MLTFKTAETLQELAGIIALQKANLPQQLTRQEKAEQGFVTVIHQLQDLQKMNVIEPHIIAVDDDKVVAYVLAMTAQSAGDIPILKPMFLLFEELRFKGKAIAAHPYIVVGQVCVDKAYRGSGIFQQAYLAYKNTHAHKYAFAITEIATANQRSLQAHLRLGFQVIHTYTAADSVQWEIVIWDWQGKK